MIACTSSSTIEKLNARLQRAGGPPTTPTCTVPTVSCMRTSATPCRHLCRVCMARGILQYLRSRVSLLRILQYSPCGTDCIRFLPCSILQSPRSPARPQRTTTGEECAAGACSTLDRLSGHWGLPTRRVNPSSPALPIVSLHTWHRHTPLRSVHASRHPAVPAVPTASCGTDCVSCSILRYPAPQLVPAVPCGGDCGTYCEIP